jgi:hypothetical protein
MTESASVALFGRLDGPTESLFYIPFAAAAFHCQQAKA